MEIQKIATDINTFDYQYFQSSGKAWYKAMSQITKIKQEVQSLNESQAIELGKMITVDANSVEVVFGFVAPSEPITPTPKEVSTKSKVFSAAWFYMRKGIYTTFSECLTAAWKAIKIRIRLKQGKVSFSFRKSTGEIRQAIGTLDGSLFEYTKKGVRSESKLDSIKYFDLEAGSWRSFRIERLLSAA